MPPTRAQPFKPAFVLIAAPFVLGSAMFAATGWQRGMRSLPVVPVPVENPITEEKRILGKILFYDEQLSSDNTVSCATCHWHPAGGAEPRPTRHPGFDGQYFTDDDVFGSEGIIAQDAEGNYQAHPIFGLEPQVTRRASPTVINSAFSPDLFWDNRAQGPFVDPLSGETVIESGGALEIQAVEPPMDTAEMAYHGREWPQVTGKLTHARPLALASELPQDMAKAVLGARTYPELFRRAFGDGEVTPARIAKALATYQRTLISDESPWDAWNAGDDTAMTTAQVNGFNAMIGGQCFRCHPSGQFTNHLSRNIGLRPIKEDLGMGEVTGSEFDAGRFKTPTLRNSALKPVFMHTGGIDTMLGVIEFYVFGPHFPENLDPVMLNGINLSEQQRLNMTDFLVNALVDPRVANAEPPFDVPRLHFMRGEPVENPMVLTGTARPLSSGQTPRVIAVTPPLIGSDDFKLGLTEVPEGAQGHLLIASAPPVDGQVIPEQVLGPFTATHPDGLAPAATAHHPIPFSPALDGQVRYMQWRVEDPGQPEPALSDVVRVEFFCGFGACTTGCLADFNRDGTVNFFDLSDFLAAFQAQDPAADLAAPIGVFNFFDLAVFLDAFQQGCP
ncbi:MAG: hypothetical protein LAT64_11385 [Phycisphaerales bacterium]|nr:hypothetical protein [Planctomycetota bacterium]MCH8509354.1 hypothetical protein [Phycisphaerales bacterium]